MNGKKNTKPGWNSVPLGIDLGQLVPCGHAHAQTLERRDRHRLNNRLRVEHKCRGANMMSQKAGRATKFKHELEEKKDN